MNRYYYYPGNRRSIDVYGPNSHQAEQIIIDILLIRDSIRVRIPKITTACLYALALLIAQDDLYDVLVSILAGLLQFIFYRVSDILTYGIEI